MILNTSIAIVSSFFANRICNIRAKLIKHTPLPDILHQIISPIPHYIPDVLLIFSLGGLIFQNLNWSNIIEVIDYSSKCLMVRSLTTVVTTIPSCVPDNVLTGKYDLMFSGHTILFQAVASLYDLQVMSFIIKWIFPFTLVLARQHYTNDVIVAMAVYNCT